MTNDVHIARMSDTLVTRLTPQDFMAICPRDEQADEVTPLMNGDYQAWEAACKLSEDRYAIHHRGQIVAIGGCVFDATAKAYLGWAIVAKGAAKVGVRQAINTAHQWLHHCADAPVYATTKAGFDAAERTLKRLGFAKLDYCPDALEGYQQWCFVPPISGHNHDRVNTGAVL